MGRESVGLKSSLAGLLCYILGWLSGLEFLLTEKKDKFVRFHAIQSVTVFGAISVAFLILFWIPVVGWVFSWAIGAVTLFLWLMLMVRAYRGQKFKLPIAGNFAERRA